MLGNYVDMIFSMLHLLILCLKIGLGENVTLVHHLPSPWRSRAAGRMVCHMPIPLYCDDTSGDQPKRWKKHISFFFTLSGLSPQLTNQYFNCHYLTTSNSAGAMELARPIVADLMSVNLIYIFGI